MRGLRVGLLAGLLLAGSGASAVAAERDGLAWHLGAGVFGLKGKDDRAAAGDIELRLRPRPRLFDVFPLLGVGGTDDGSFYGRAGFGRTFPVAERFGVTVTFAAGYYERGDGKELGQELEFRSALGVAWRVREAVDVGLEISHLSNAGLSDVNPGVEILALTVTF